MAVITKYVVVRNGVELDKEFLVKKDADAYDKMLDAAENLAAFIKEGDLSIDLDEETIDTLSVFLAKNGPEVTRIFKGIKPVKPTSSKSALPKSVPPKTDSDSDEESAHDSTAAKPIPAKKKAPTAKAKAKPKAK
jgi:dsDNA-binding SOS-regulon protein